MGNLGKKIKKFSLQLVEHNLTHMIASDAHNTTSRGFHLAESYELIEKEFGMSVMSDLKENPYLLISGKAIYKEDPEQIRRKKLVRYFLNKELVMSPNRYQRRHSVVLWVEIFISNLP